MEVMTTKKPHHPVLSHIVATPLLLLPQVPPYYYLVQFREARLSI